MTMLVPLLLGSTPVALTFLEGLSADIDNGVSHLIPEQVPSFVATDHSQFVEFIKQYYEWMEFEGNPKYESNKLLDYKDVDDTSDYLLSSFFKEFINGLPVDFASSSTDKRKLIKKIIDLYRAKGTERSYKSFFRLVFGETPSFFYPGNYIIKTSSGRWKEPTILRTTCIRSGDYLNQISGVKIQQNLGVGRSINASGFIQNAVRKNIGQYDLLEIEVTDLFGNFIPEKDVTINLVDSTITEYLYPVIDAITVISAGSGYKIGDPISITTDGAGIGAQFFVGSVGESGNVKTIESYDHGINYRNSDSITVLIGGSGGGSGVLLSATGGSPSYLSTGYWEGGSGLLSGSNRLQDNNYWQDFSYAIKSSRSLNEYSDTVKKVLHPAGYRLFGLYSISDSDSATGDVSRSFRTIETPIIGHYTPYRNLTERNLRANGEGGSGGIDLYPEGYLWQLAIGNTYYQEDSDPASPSFALGNSGPLGGYTHTVESLGYTSSEGPGGTLNAPQGSQFEVIDGSVEDTYSNVNYWEVYPLPTTRGVNGILNYSQTRNVSRVNISRYETSLYSEASLGFDDGEIVRQILPRTQQATGKIVSLTSVNGYRYCDIVTFSGKFLLTGSVIPGGTCGFLQGVSSGITAYINNIADQYSDLESVNSMGSIRLKDFLNGISKSEFEFGSDKDIIT